MLTLYRYNQTETITQGLILHQGIYLSDSLELPWKDNEPCVSCIPEGLYKIEWIVEGLKSSPCYRILDVPGRVSILMHVANTLRELLGCIAPGTKCGEMVTNSTKALDHIFTVAGSRTDLLITNKFGW